MIMNKYRSQERLPFALRSSGTADGEVGIETEPAVGRYLRVIVLSGDTEHLYLPSA